MNKINIIITFVAAAFLSACATFNPQYRNSENNLQTNPSEKDIDKTFYFIGNAGKGGDEASKAVKSLKKYLAENNTEDSYVVFLGNSLYPSGMQPKDDAAKKEAEKSMQLQLDALKDFKGKVVVLPGNRDWKSGVDGLELEEDFLKAKFNDADILQYRYK